MDKSTVVAVLTNLKDCAREVRVNIIFSGGCYIGLDPRRMMLEGECIEYKGRFDVPEDEGNVLVDISSIVAIETYSGRKNRTLSATSMPQR